jgi:hypothetical protein
MHAFTVGKHLVHDAGLAIIHQVFFDAKKNEEL